MGRETTIWSCWGLNLAGILKKWPITEGVLTEKLTKTLVEWNEQELNYSSFYSSDQFHAVFILCRGYISLRPSNNEKVSPSLLRAAQVTLTGLYTYNKVFKQYPTEFSKCLTFFAKCRAKGCQCELRCLYTSRTFRSDYYCDSHQNNTTIFFLSTHPDQTHFKTYLHN